MIAKAKRKRKKSESKPESVNIYTDAVPIGQISMDHASQMRVVKIDPAIVEAYAADMEDGDEFPPVKLFHDGKTYYIGDGFHRIEAASKIGRESIPATIQPGTQRDAILYAMGANSTHGLRRTNADKRNSVETILRDPDWSKWSHTDIAKVCGVTRQFVHKVKNELTSVNIDTDAKPESVNIYTPDTPASVNIDTDAKPESVNIYTLAAKMAAGIADDVLIAECEQRGWEVIR